MSKKDDEIDWSKVIDAEEKPDIPPEKLWIQLERMRRAQTYLPRWYVFKQAVTLLYILIYLTSASFLVVNRAPFVSILILILGGNVFLLIDYFRVVYNISRRAAGNE